MEVTITRFETKCEPAPGRRGFTILARFDCTVAGFGFKGCALLHRAKGWTVWGPSRHVYIPKVVLKEIKKIARARYDTDSLVSIDRTEKDDL